MNETNAALLKNHRFKEKYCRKHQSLDADIPKYVGLREKKVQMLLLLAKKQHKFVVHSAANKIAKCWKAGKRRMKHQTWVTARRAESDKSVEKSDLNPEM